MPTVRAGLIACDYRTVGFTFRNSGSNSSDMSRMLDNAGANGMPAQLVRMTMWLQPSSAQ